jgi:hypothetical protein
MHHPNQLKLTLAALLSATGLECDRNRNSEPPTIEVRSEQLASGGLYIVYVWGCARGCDQLAKGDLIVAVDGVAVTATRDLDRLTSGQPLRLTVRRSQEVIEVDVSASPGGPPFSWIGAAELDRAPQWARRNLFAHVSPMLGLIHIDGGIVDSATMLGKRRLLVFWDHATRVEQAEAINMMQVLQRADADLQAAGVEVMFIHHRFPSNDGRQAPMNDTNLRLFQQDNSVPGGSFLPMYRLPNAVEHKRVLMRGLEGATTYFQYLRQSPAIVLLDERGIIRWHSEGLQEPPADDAVFAGKADQFTIVQAIEFAKQAL